MICLMLLLLTVNNNVTYKPQLVICLYAAPYGIREGPRKLGRKSEEVKPVCEDQLSFCAAYHTLQNFGDFT